MHFIILLIFTLLPEVKSDSVLPDDCGKMEVKYSTTELSNNQDIKIELKVTGGSEPYYYFFFDKKNNPLNWDFKQSYCTVEKNDLPKYVKVLDSSGCTKMIDFNESANR